MSDETARLRAELAAAKHAETAARADVEWQAGRRDLAVVVLDDGGWHNDEVVAFCVDRGLTDEQARDLIRDAPTNPL
jgi:hypothetical protein